MRKQCSIRPTLGPLLHVWYSHCESLWVTMGHFESFESFWVTLSHFELLWVTLSNLSHFESLGVPLSHFESLWISLSHFDSIWVTLSHCMSLSLTFTHIHSLSVTLNTQHSTLNTQQHMRCLDLIMWSQGQWEVRGSPENIWGQVSSQTNRHINTRTRRGPKGQGRVKIPFINIGQPPYFLCNTNLWIQCNYETFSDSKKL